MRPSGGCMSRSLHFEQRDEDHPFDCYLSKSLHVGKMADSEQESHNNRIRKLRKKLRQIENLQRLCGERDLTEEEYDKITQKGNIREQLKELIAMAIEDDNDQEMKAQERKLQSDKKDNENDDNVAQEKKEAQKEDELNLHLQEGIDEEVVKVVDQDTTMESVCEAEAHDEITDQKVALEEKNISNETDDLKIQKAGKKGSGKRKGENPKDWKQMQFSVKVIEGHHHPLCAVDFHKDSIISGGHDTSFKIWNLNTTEEVHSLGGHTGSISAALILSEDKAATGSKDCSFKIWDIKSGQTIASTYVFNPVTCLAHRNGLLAIGNEGGKIDIYDIEKEQIIISAKAHEEALVSVAFMDDDNLAAAAFDGVLKVYKIENNELVKVVDSYDDITSVTSFKKDARSADTPNNSMMNLPLRKINCIATFGDVVFWGDDGFNIKAFNTLTGEIVKMRNNLNEYSPTDALTVLKDGESGYLFSSGFDLDTGSGYINVRKLPSMEYLGTIADESLGHVSCIAASLNDGKIQLVTGGSELRVWQQSTSGAGKKRRASDDIDDVIPCKFICSYNKARESEDESESEDEATEEASDSNMPSTKQSEGKSWCVVQ